jgi:hypothetical protein
LKYLEKHHKSLGNVENHLTMIGDVETYKKYRKYRQLLDNLEI